MSARAATLAVLALLAGCAAAGRPPEGWRLQTLNGQALPGSVAMSLGADGTVSGEGPCNLWRARNTVTPPGFILGPIAATRRACLIEGGEARFLAAMAAATQARREGAMLVLTGPGTRLVFAPEAAQGGL